MDYVYVCICQILVTLIFGKGCNGFLRPNIWSYSSVHTSCWLLSFRALFMRILTLNFMTENTASGALKGDGECIYCMVIGCMHLHPLSTLWTLCLVPNWMTQLFITHHLLLGDGEGWVLDEVLSRETLPPPPLPPQLNKRWWRGDDKNAFQIRKYMLLKSSWQDFWRKSCPECGELWGETWIRGYKGSRGG